MTDHRTRMMAAFKSRFVPALRERGFVGAFPHFRRPRPERLDLLTVQFNKYGGSFVVELGRCGPEGLTEGPWQDLPVEKINVGHLFHERRRLTPRDLHKGWRGAEWFEFGPANTDDPEPAGPQDDYDALADQTLKAFDEVGESWLARPAAPDTGAPANRSGARPPLIARLLGFS